MSPIYDAASSLVLGANRLLGVRDASKHIAVLTRRGELVLRVKTVHAKRNSWVKSLTEFDGYRVRVECTGRAAGPNSKKGWSVHDADHIPVGSRVMLRVDPHTIHPEVPAMCEAFGLEAEHQRFGAVLKRWFRGGDYSVALENSRYNRSITLKREHLVYPIPENAVPFAKPETNLRKWRTKIGAPR